MFVKIFIIKKHLFCYTVTTLCDKVEEEGKSFEKKKIIMWNLN